MLHGIGTIVGPFGPFTADPAFGIGALGGGAGSGSGPGPDGGDTTIKGDDDAHLSDKNRIGANSSDQQSFVPVVTIG